MRWFRLASGGVALVVAAVLGRHFNAVLWPGLAIIVACVMLGLTSLFQGVVSRIGNPAPTENLEEAKNRAATMRLSIVVLLITLPWFPAAWCGARSWELERHVFSADDANSFVREAQRFARDVGYPDDPVASLALGGLASAAALLFVLLIVSPWEPPSATKSRPDRSPS